jgi:hypothetical protein
MRGLGGCDIKGFAVGFNIGLCVGDLPKGVGIEGLTDCTALTDGEETIGLLLDWLIPYPKEAGCVALRKYMV